MMSDKLFDVCMFHVDPKTGVDTKGYRHGLKMNATPMNHTDACIFKSKMMNRGPGIAFRLVEVPST